MHTLGSCVETGPIDIPLVDLTDAVHHTAVVGDPESTKTLAQAITFTPSISELATATINADKTTVTDFYIDSVNDKTKTLAIYAKPSVSFGIDLKDTELDFKDDITVIYYLISLCNNLCDHIVTQAQLSDTVLNKYFTEYVKAKNLADIFKTIKGIEGSEGGRKGKPVETQRLVVDANTDKVIREYWSNLFKKCAISIKTDFNANPAVLQIIRDRENVNNLRANRFNQDRFDNVVTAEENCKLITNDEWTNILDKHPDLIHFVKSNSIFFYLFVIDFIGYIEAEHKLKVTLKIGDRLNKNSDKVPIYVDMYKLIEGMCSICSTGNNVYFIKTLDVHFMNTKIQACVKPFCDFVKVDNRGRLHNFEGPACGTFGAPSTYIYAVEGIRLPEWVYTLESDKVDVSHIINQKNAEIRRILIQKFGINKLLSVAEIIDKKYNYELVAIPLDSRALDHIKAPIDAWSSRMSRRDNSMGVYLVMTNPSTGAKHVEGVGLACATVEEAICWRNGIQIDSLLIKDAEFVQNTTNKKFQYVFVHYAKECVEYFQQGDVLMFPQDGPRDERGRIMVSLLPKVLT